MKLLNATTDESTYEDVMIIAVPDKVYEDPDVVLQEFWTWLHETKDHDYWKTDESGHRYVGVGQAEFVEWLNKNHK